MPDLLWRQSNMAFLALSLFLFMTVWCGSLPVGGVYYPHQCDYQYE